MTRSEAQTKVIEILLKNKLTYKDGIIGNLDSVDFFKAQKIENSIEACVFKNEAGEDCVFQIIDDKLFEQEL